MVLGIASLLTCLEDFLWIQCQKTPGSQTGVTSLALIQDLSVPHSRTLPQSPHAPRRAGMLVSSLDDQLHRTRDRLTGSTCMGLFFLPPNSQILLLSFLPSFMSPAVHEGLRNSKFSQAEEFSPLSYLLLRYLVLIKSWNPYQIQFSSSSWLTFFCILTLTERNSNIAFTFCSATVGSSSISATRQKAPGNWGLCCMFLCNSRFSRVPGSEPLLINQFLIDDW